MLPDEDPAAHIQSILYPGAACQSGHQRRGPAAASNEQHRTIIGEIFEMLANMRQWNMLRP